MKSTLFLSAATLIFSAAQAQVTDTTGRTNNTGNTTNTMGTNNTMGNTGTNTGTTSGTNTSAMGTTTDMSATGVDNTRKLNQYGSYSTRDSIAAKYKLQPMPGALTIEKTFPILGSYQLNTAPESGSVSGSTTTTTSGNTTTGTAGTTSNTATDVAVDAAPQVTITLDSASKGIVWVEGLKQGRLKAYLKKSPATYRVVAQKSASGVAIPEGTMHLDAATNTLHIALGAPYLETDPTAIFNLSNGTASVDNTAEVKVKTKDTKVKSKVVFITATKVDATQQQGTATDATQPATQQTQQEQQ